jgi:regulator of protease activity HflC (stomatin/prohibitin superfamily)
MFLIILGLIILVGYFAIGRRFLPESVRSGASALVGILGFAMVLGGGWTGAFFYADPGYNYQVRLITGEVVGYNSPGWKLKLFGTVVPWRKAMSVAHTVRVDEEGEESSASILPPHTIRMLDRVDGKVKQTTRFRLPDDPETFLALAEEYRTPDNLLRTELIPTVEQVITASSSLMSAEDYFNGKRNDFQLDYDYQMRNGIFIVQREEIRADASTPRTASADASKGTDQEEYGDQEQTYFRVTKLMNEDGSFKTRSHNYQRFGIQVVDAKITDFTPNHAFIQRMEMQQKASADRSVAREQRIQEEEQKQLAIVRGDREIAEEQAKVKKAQIKRTTEAETEKALALIEAERVKEQAEIQREAAAIQLERDRLIAQSKEVLADADKYEREARIEGDGALQQKLDAWVRAQEVWAEASAKRAVPTNVTVLGGGNGGGDVPTGANTEMQTLNQLMSLNLARQLNVDTTITGQGK